MQRTRQAVHSIQLIAYETGRAQHPTYETGLAQHPTHETGRKVQYETATYETGREQHPTLSQGRKEGSGHGQQGKPKPASGQDQKGKKRGSYKKEINQGEGPIELGQVHGEEEVVVFLSLTWIVVDLYMC